jgi:hypothetical protein
MREAQFRRRDAGREPADKKVFEEQVRCPGVAAPATGRSPLSDAYLDLVGARLIEQPYNPGAATALWQARGTPLGRRGAPRRVGSTGTTHVRESPGRRRQMDLSPQDQAALVDIEEHLERCDPVLARALATFDAERTDPQPNRCVVARPERGKCPQPVAGEGKGKPRGPGWRRAARAVLSWTAPAAVGFGGGAVEATVAGGRISASALSAGAGTAAAVLGAALFLFRSVHAGDPGSRRAGRFRPDPAWRNPAGRNRTSVLSDALAAIVVRKRPPRGTAAPGGLARERHGTGMEIHPDQRGGKP